MTEAINRQTNRQTEAETSPPFGGCKKYDIRREIAFKSCQYRSVNSGGQTPTFLTEGSMSLQNSSDGFHFLKIFQKGHAVGPS